ncbi:MAG: hypothetical protein ACO1TH_16970 [Luteitalea sp.]
MNSNHVTDELPVWERPELVELGDAAAIVQGGGNCCYDHGGLIGDKDGGYTDVYDDVLIG